MQSFARPFARRARSGCALASRARMLCSSGSPVELIDTDKLATLTPSRLKRLAALDTIQSATMQVEEEHLRRLAEMEKETRSRMSVLTGRRQQIISGESEPTAQEVDDSALLNSALLKSPAVKARLEGAASGAEPAGLPGFWPAALRACSEQGHAKLFTEKDWEVLEYLTGKNNSPTISVENTRISPTGSVSKPQSAANPPPIRRLIRHSIRHLIRHSIRHLIRHAPIGPVCITRHSLPPSRPPPPLLFATPPL